MASIANIIVSMIADTGKFDTDLKRSSKQATAEMKKMQKDAADMGNKIGVAFVAAAGAMTLIVAKTINAADHIRDLSQKTGISTAALSEYASATAKAGTTLDTFVSGVNKMQKSLVAAASGSQAQSAAFERLGLSVQDLLKLSPDKQFEAIAEALSGLGNAAEKTAVSQAIFGKGAAALAPLMAEGAKGIEEARAAAVRFGVSIGQDFADNADRFKDNMVDIRDIGQGIANQFTAGLLPALISLQEGFIGMDRDISAAQKTGEAFGDFIKQLVAAFIVLKAVVTAVGVTIVATLVTIAGGFAALISPITGFVKTLGDVTAKIASGDIAGGLAELANTGANIKASFNSAAEAIKTAGAATADTWGNEVPAAIQKAFGVMNATTTVTKKAETAIAGVTGAIHKTSDAVKEWSNRQKIASKSIEENIKFVEELEKAQEEYNQTLQDFIDIGDPVGAMVREFSRQLEFANTALAAGDITLKQYQDSLNALSDGLGKAAAGLQETAAESDAMTEAMLEGVRILERAFQGMWDSIFSGGEGMFKGLAKGFKSLLSQMVHDLTTGPLIRELQKLLKGESIDTGAITSSLAGLAGIGLGTLIGGGGQNASAGAAIGTIIGTAAGGVIGSVIGGILGGLLGGLLEKKNNPPRLAVGGSAGARNVFASGQDSQFATEFGTTFLRTKRLDAQAIADVKKSIVEFDSAISSFLDDDQIGAIADALAKWNANMSGEAISIEQLLGSRFDTIMSTFSQTLQDFVNGAVSLEDKVSRLQVGVSAEKLFKDQPDLFGQHTVAEFLTVVTAFQDGTQTIVDAFNEVLALLAVIQTVKDSLTDFGSSNLGADFNALLRLQAESVVDTLSRLTSGLDDAMREFDGSPEQLVAIGNLAMSVRQQELVALSLIDSVAKGLNSNLARLKEDVTRNIQGPRTAEAILTQARDLITSVSQAKTPEEIAAIGQQFEELIRSLSPEDQKRFGTSTLAIIEAFQAASNLALDQAKQAILDSGQAIRDMTAGFATLIDPLTIIVNSNERAALALESIAKGEAVVTVLPLATENDTSGQFPQEVGDAIVNSIRQGFTGANIVVNVTVQESGGFMVTQ